MTERKSIFVIRTLALLLSLLMACPALGDEKISEEDALKSRESATRVVTILGRNYLYYAQNSPEWKNLVIDSDPESKHIFGDSACMIAALANCVANSINVWDMDRILYKTRYPVRIDTHSAVNGRGVGAALKFEITEISDVLRYFPLVIGNYIGGGNNRTGEHNRKSSAFYRNVLDMFQLDWEKNGDITDAMHALDAGKMVIACSGGVRSVIAEGGHYFVLVGRKDGYVYVMDSYLRDSFPMDGGHLIEMLEPGVWRFHEVDIYRIPILVRYIVTPNADRTIYTKAFLDDYLSRSNAHK